MVLVVIAVVLPLVGSPSSESFTYKKLKNFEKNEKLV